MFPGIFLTRPSVHPALPGSRPTRADQSLLGTAPQAPTPAPARRLPQRGLDRLYAIRGHLSDLPRQQPGCCAGLEF